jgi:hypothetical protein
MPGTAEFQAKIRAGFCSKEGRPGQSFSGYDWSNFSYDLG